MMMIDDDDDDDFGKETWPEKQIPVLEHPRNWLDFSPRSFIYMHETTMFWFTWEQCESNTESTFWKQVVIFSGMADTLGCMYIVRRRVLWR
jgi:hypothetical protein